MYEDNGTGQEVRPTGETGRALSTEMAVTVSVTNVDEKGEITLQWLEPEVGTDIQAQLEDPDGAPANVTFTGGSTRLAVHPTPSLTAIGKQSRRSVSTNCRSRYKAPRKYNALHYHA